MGIDCWKCPNEEAPSLLLSGSLCIPWSIVFLYLSEVLELFMKQPWSCFYSSISRNNILHIYKFLQAQVTGNTGSYVCCALSNLKIKSAYFNIKKNIYQMSSWRGCLPYFLNQFNQQAILQLSSKWKSQIHLLFDS